MAYDVGVFLLFAFIFTVVPVMQTLHPDRKLCIGMNNVKGILLHFFLIDQPALHSVTRQITFPQ